MRADDVRILGAVAAFEREGAVVGRTRLSERADIDGQKAWLALQRLIDAGFVEDEPARHPVGGGRPVRHYSLTQRAAHALEALEVGGG